jgi:hypothetical protein
VVLAPGLRANQRPVPKPTAWLDSLRVEDEPATRSRLHRRPRHQLSCSLRRVPERLRPGGHRNFIQIDTEEPDRVDPTRQVRHILTALAGHSGEWQRNIGHCNTIEVVALNAAIRQPELPIVRISDNA